VTKAEEKNLHIVRGESLPKTGFSVSKVKSGPTKVLLSLKDLLITTNVTHMNAWYKLLLILYDYKNSSFFCALIICATWRGG
jgi:hypothetical protein